MKTCCFCKKQKPLEEFHNHKTRGKQGFCISCGNKRMAIYRATPKAQAANRARWQHRSLPEKVAIFKRADKTKDPNVTTNNLLKKFGQNPHCHLTGQAIDFNDWDSYSLDHILPVSKGGKSTLDNCGLACRDVNYAKGALTNERFLALCQRVVDWAKVGRT